MKQYEKYLALILLVVGLLSQSLQSYAFIPSTDRCIELNTMELMPLSPDSIFARDSMRKLMPMSKTATGDTCIESKSILAMSPVDKTILTKENLNKVLPTTMSPGTDQNLFYTQFTTGMELKATQSLTELLLYSPGMKDAGITKTVDTVQKAATQSVSVPALGVTHKLTFNVRYETKTATAQYSGFFTLSTTYLQATNNVATTLSKELSKSTSVSLSNTSPMGQFDQNAFLSIGHTF